jgi:hypothetical protein
VRAWPHRACLPAAANFPPFLVLCPLLEAALRHILVDFGTANLRSAAHGENRSFLAAFQLARHGIDDAVVQQLL